MSFQDLYGMGGMGNMGMPVSPSATPAPGSFTQNPALSLQNLLAGGRSMVGSLLPATGFGTTPAAATPSPALPPAPTTQSAAPATPMQSAMAPPGVTAGVARPPSPPAVGAPMSLAPPNPGPSAPPNPGTMQPGMMQNFLQMLRQSQGTPGSNGGMQAPGQAPGPMGQNPQGLIPKGINDFANIMKMFGGGSAPGAASAAAGAPGAAAAGAGAGGGFSGMLAGLF